ncbi:MAG TPA: sigma-70 family RNA polymerase sigma factor [Ktedonobacterales bacterium]|nr:sigma-70 family RNA polymerase sigma factor [Ktedonobacterales bacterium]
MGDDDFALLITPHLMTMLRVARVMVGADDAEDVAQEAVTSAWRRRADLRDASAVRAWLLRITVNTCRNWRRARNNPAGRYAVSLTEEPLLPEGLYASDPGASDHAIRLDLRQAIASLEAESQQLIALRYFAGLDSTEIGALLGIPAATVRTRLRRALHLLRERLTGHRRDLAAPAGEKGNADV